MNGVMLDGSSKPLVVKHAEDQKERQQRLQQKSMEQVGAGVVCPCRRASMAECLWIRTIVDSYVCL
jgi:hypothetical protein